jgi:hypothetical protein
MVDGKIEDVGVPMPTGEGRFGHAVGRFPDALWWVRSQNEEAAPPYDNGAPAVELVRWDQKRKDWTRVRGQLPLKKPGNVSQGLLLGMVGPERLLVVEHFLEDADSFTTRLHVASYGTGKPAFLPAMTDANGRAVLENPTDMATFDNGDVLILGSKEEEQHAAIWAGSSKPELYKIGDGSCFPHGLTTLSRSEMVVVGVIHGQPPKPCAFRFDGRQWSAEALPPRNGEALSYAKEPSGEEWLVLREQNRVRDSVWTRNAGRSWQEVFVPLPEGDVISNCGGSVWPRGKVWVSEQGGVWVTINLCDRCHWVSIVLLQSRPASSACRFDRKARHCQVFDPNAALPLRSCDPKDWRVP